MFGSCAGKAVLNVEEDNPRRPKRYDGEARCVQDTKIKVIGDFY